MSRNDWESGTLKLPTAAWPKFKKDLRDGFNAQQSELFAYSLKIHAQLVANGKGKRKFDYSACLYKLVYPESTAIFKPYSPGWEPNEDQKEKILSNGLTTDRKKPKKPVAKDFPWATTKTLRFNAGLGGTISLSPLKETKVGWNVSENNHAVEYANSTNTANLLFKLLGKVNWTRATGGIIVGNDEYNQDAGEYGGGANYVTHRFGPLGKP